MRRIVKSRPTKQNIWVQRSKTGINRFVVVVQNHTHLPGSMIDGKFVSHLSANQNHAITRAIKAEDFAPCWAIPANTR